LAIVTNWHVRLILTLGQSVNLFCWSNSTEHIGTCNRFTPLLQASRTITTMPCIHCARRDVTLSTGAASTSSRCEQAAPIQRVPQSRSGQQQLQQQLQRSRAAFTRAVRLCEISPRQKMQLTRCHSQRQVTPNCVQDQVIQTHNSQRIGRCMLQGFAAAAVLSLLAPGPSYSAETLPIGLLKSWVVSFLILGLCPCCC